MSDILYFEKSELFTLQTSEILSQLKCICAVTEKEFFMRLRDTLPKIILVGDTGPLNPVIFLFALKAIPVLNNIPVIFLGENDFINILPVQASFKRTKDNVEEFKTRIYQLIYKSKGEMEESLEEYKKNTLNPSEEDLYNLAFKAMEKDIIQDYFYNIISGSDIIDSTEYDAVKLIMGKLLDLFYFDFSYYVMDTNREYKSMLYTAYFLEESQQNELTGFCQESLPDALKNPEVKTEYSCNNVDKPPEKREWTSSIAIQETIPLSKGLSGFLVMGTFGERKSVLKSWIKKNIPSIVAYILESAFVYYKKKNETDTMFRAFTHFLPAPIINDLLIKKSEKALMTGEKRRIVVLFSHIRHFETIVEKNSPERVVSFLNSHFTNMVQIITDHGGTIDKFIGDAIFAIFGAPISYRNNAERAAQSAIEMIKSFENIPLEGYILPDTGFSIGIGLNEGEAIIGNIGCSDKFDYTAIGDTVNLAARLESLTKHYHQDIFISEIIYKQINKQYYCRLTDRAKVKGKSEASDIYSLIVFPDKYSEKWRELYKRGFSMYILGNWCTAMGYFEAAQKIIPDDYVCKLLIDRCEEYQVYPPEKWDGSVALDFK